MNEQSYILNEGKYCMAKAFDFKKECKDLYLPKTEPNIIDVPEILFIMINGTGNPNTSDAYKNALEVLYGLSYSIKMSKMSGMQPNGYFDFIVPPLEGLWWLKDGGVITGTLNKDNFCWTSMLRQPEFVTNEVFEIAKFTLLKKKPNLDLSAARLVKVKEGLCAQMLHIGPYDSEPTTIAVLEKFIEKSGYTSDFDSGRRHHEIYFSDPRKTVPDKLKTVIRYPIVKS